MFFVEMIAGKLAGSQALQADTLDFFGDAVTYGISMAVIGATLRTVPEARAAIGKYLTFYNSKRPHSSLDGQPPDQVYFNPLQPIPVAA